MTPSKLSFFQGLKLMLESCNQSDLSRKMGMSSSYLSNLVNNFNSNPDRKISPETRDKLYRHMPALRLLVERGIVEHPVMTDRLMNRSPEHMAKMRARRAEKKQGNVVVPQPTIEEVRKVLRDAFPWLPDLI